MALIYQDAWEAWASVSDGPFMQNTDVGKSSVWGSFGLRQTLDDAPPRAELLDRLNAQTSPWWPTAKGGLHYQHGITQIGTERDERLIGTLQEDYLIGRSGNDTFFGGPQDDGLHGGAGVDIAIFTGTFAQYTIAPEERGYRVIGPDGSDFLIEIEDVQFDDTERMALAQIAPILNGVSQP